MAQAIELIGATIGNYRITAKIGEGGMGTVYLAEHPLIGKKVALKVLHSEHTGNADVVARFFTEAKAVNDIGHPNIVDIVDYGQVQTAPGQSFVYFIMEYLQGEPLSSLIHRDAPLPPERAMSIAIQIADALSASHAKGVVHRDLKPDNIYLVNRGRGDVIKLLDFGIAKLVSDPSGSKRTRTGIVMGTPAYMSPEQCEGKGQMDHRTDVYALGIVLYEMITGRVPFTGEGYGEILVQHLTQPCPPPSIVRQGVPPAVDAILLRALEKKRDHRFQTMDEMLDAMKDPNGYLARVGGPRVVAAPTQVAGPQPPVAFRDTPTGLRSPTFMDDSAPAKKSRMPLFLGGGVALAAAVLGIVLLSNKGDKKPDPGPDPATMAGAATKPEPTKPEPTKPDPVTTPDPTPIPTTPVEPVKPARQEVSIKVVSSPPGAQIYLDGAREPRGITPSEVVLPADGSQHAVTLKLSGYKDRTERFAAATGAGVDARLSKVVPRTVGDKTTKTTTKPGDKKPTGFKAIVD